MHTKFQGIAERISKRPEEASHEDLNALHEMLAHPKEIGVDPAYAARKRDGIAALLAGRSQKKKPIGTSPLTGRISKFE